MLDLDRVQAFAVFAELMNFTHAARRLAISQPALHTKIRKLEEEVGSALYRRVGRQLELTEAGIEAQRFGEELLRQRDAFLSRVRGTAAMPVRLSAGEGSLLYLLGPSLRRFQREGAELRIHTHNREQTIQALLHGEADVGVTQLDGACPERLGSRQLIRVPQVLVFPRGHALTRRRRVRLEDLADEPWILPPVSRPHRQALERALGSRGVTPKVAVEANGWPLMLSCVKRGLGICVVNGFVGLERGLLSRPLRELPSLTYQVLYRPEALKRTPVRQLVDALLAETPEY
ncbi:MAG: LysR family transcriptional regulator [Myxococcales bacterium]|nr:LysR family transcriptional regulator [Myxococcales bacterium]